jgi:hypothetical protein
MRTLFDAVTSEAARLSGLTLADLRGEDTSRAVSRARQRAMWAIRTLRPDVSTIRVGHYFRRDHTTVMHACRKIDDLRYEDDFERALCSALLDTLRPRCVPGPVGMLDAVDAKLVVAALSGRGVAEAAAHAQVPFQVAEARLNSMAEALARAVGRGLVDAASYSRRPAALVLVEIPEPRTSLRAASGRSLDQAEPLATGQIEAPRVVRTAKGRDRKQPTRGAVHPHEIEPGRAVPNNWDKALFEPWAVRKARLAAERGRAQP